MGKNLTKKLFFVLIISFVLVQQSNAQNLTTPRVSPQAEVTQTIGISKITINYSRPAVNDRQIWGNVVQYGMITVPFGNGKPHPWRAGANENTTVTFTDDVKINGEPLKAGTYGLHLLVNENEDWVFIFSKDTRAWGSYFYEESNDALRVNVTPEEASFKERLVYGFDEITSNSAQAYLHWEKVKVGFTCEFDVTSLAIKGIKDQLTGLPGFNWQAWQQAAFYCLQSNSNLDEGEEWIRRSIALNENANNRNLLGYVLAARDKNDEAMKVFRENVEMYPENWNVYDSLGEALNNAGDTEGAIEYYEKAFEMAPQNQKPRIEGILTNLKS